MRNNLNVKVREIIAGHFGIDPERLTDEARFREDLGADWLDFIENRDVKKTTAGWPGSQPRVGVS